MDTAKTLSIPESAVMASGLTKRLGDKLAVDNIDFDVPFGTIMGLLGPNGAGKTTTLRMLAGHLLPTEGTVSICGSPLAESVDEAKRRLGFLSAGMRLYAGMS